jgi:hypothetical protein
MEALGIMLYGYSKDDAMTIKDALSGLTGRELTIVCAARQESEKVKKILEMGLENVYEAKTEKVLMFLNFDDEQISACMKGFPKRKGLKRPIFCGVTKENLDWRFDRLLEHLLEEKKRWDEMDSKD